MDKGFLSMAQECLVHTCCYCGHTGLDVGSHLQHGWLGGEVLRVECDNRVECWQRLDEQSEDDEV